MIRKSVLVALFTTLPFAAHAQLYIEGNIGAAFVSDIDVDVDGTPPGTISLDLGTELLFGAEVGVTGIGNANNLRFGLGLDHLSADLEGVTASGFGLPGSGSFSCSELEMESGGDVTCSDLEITTNILSANAYIDLNMGNEMGIIPFIGVGAGYAFIEDSDAELALSGSLGARLLLGNNGYIGGRYRFQWINGTSDGDFSYDSITSHGLSVILGLTM